MAITTRGAGLQVAVQYAGRRYRETLRCTLEEARAFEARVKQDLVAGRTPVPFAATSQQSRGALFLKDALDIVYREYWADAAVHRTVLSNIATALEFFGEATPLASITNEQADAYVRKLKAEGYAPSTIRSKCCVMTKAFSHFRRLGHVTNPPTFKMPSVGDSNLRDRLVEDEEFTELVRLFRVDYEVVTARRSDGPSGADYAALWVILMDTGVRRSEAEAIDLRNLRGDMLTLTKTKNNKRRTIPLTERAAQALSDLSATYGNTPCSWATSGSVRHAWDWARAEMGLSDDEGFIPYALRHTCASTLYARTKDIVLVQKWLGHSDLKMTLRYAKLQPYDLAAARDLMEAP
jgi:integrase